MGWKLLPVVNKWAWGCWNKNVHGGKNLKKKINGEEHQLGTQE